MKKVWSKILTFLKFLRDDVIKFPAYILAHPLKGFEEMKRYGKGKISVSITLIIIAIVLNIMSIQYSAIIVNDVKISEIDSVSEIFYILGAVSVVTVANWSVTTLFDGKGNMKNIFMMVTYCLYPYIWSSLIAMIFSNIITTDELAIYALIRGLGTFMTGYMFFFGIISIHEYGLGQCLLTILFTVVAILIIIFAGILVFDLGQKIYAFFYQLYQEITLRGLL